MEPFSVCIDSDARIVVRGDVDMATAPQLREAIEAVAGSGRQRVVVNLAGVSFMDSSGIAALCLAKQTLDERSAVLALASLSRPVQAILELAGVASEFVLETTDP